MSLTDFLPVWLYCLQHNGKRKQNHFWMFSWLVLANVQSLGRWLTQAPQELLAPFQDCAVSLWAPLSHFVLCVFILSSTTIFSNTCEAPGFTRGGRRKQELPPCSRLALKAAVCLGQLPWMFKSNSPSSWWMTSTYFYWRSFRRGKYL